jgi:hypothetical protein
MVQNTKANHREENGEGLGVGVRVPFDLYNPSIPPLPQMLRTNRPELHRTPLQIRNPQLPAQNLFGIRLQIGFILEMQLPLMRVHPRRRPHAVRRQKMRRQSFQLRSAAGRTPLRIGVPRRNRPNRLVPMTAPALQVQNRHYEATNRTPAKSNGNRQLSGSKVVTSDSNSRIRSPKAFACVATSAIRVNAVSLCTTSARGVSACSRRDRSDFKSAARSPRRRSNRFFASAT